MNSQIMKTIEKKLESRSRLIIGIDGRAASGKSTLADYLEDYFDATVFHVDDYFLPNERKTNLRLKEPGGNFDYERMEKEIFHHLHDKEIQSNKFNCTTQKIMVNPPVTLKNVVVIEGVYSLHPKFYPYYDLKIFLDVDEETQKDRILKRSNKGMLERFVNEFIPLEEKYFNACDLRNRVDIVHKI